MRNIYRTGLLLTVMLVIAACGTVATPRYEADRIIGEAQAEATHIIETALAQGGEVEAVAVEPTESATEEMTEEATEIATEEVTEEATEIATEEATEEHDDHSAAGEATAEVTEEADEATEEATEEHDDHSAAGETSENAELEAEIEAAVDAADAAAGEITFLSTGCVACHMTTDMVMIGPGLANVFSPVGDHAAHRPEGQGPYEYIFISIRNSQAFVVEGFPPFVMPIFSEAQLSDQDIYNIMAYLRQFSNLPE